MEYREWTFDPFLADSVSNTVALCSSTSIRQGKDDRRTHHERPEHPLDNTQPDSTTHSQAGCTSSNFSSTHSFQYQQSAAEYEC